MSGSEGAWLAIEAGRLLAAVPAGAKRKMRLEADIRELAGEYLFLTVWGELIIDY